jgi:hypothetical protein
MKILSKLFIFSFLVSIILVSCDVSDDGFIQTSQVSPILDVVVPDTMVTGETYSLEITYQRDSNCHTLSTFDTAKQGDSLLFLRAITLFNQTSTCNEIAEGVPVEIDFTNNFESNFRFKFLNSRDSIGDPVYLDRDIVVIGD